MSKFQKFITMNGRVELGVPVALFATAIVCSTYEVPYVTGVMTTIAAILLIVGLVDIVREKKRVD